MRQIIDTFNDDYGNPVFKIYISSCVAQKQQKRLHRHTEFEISLFLSGNGIYNTDLGNFDFFQGDIFLFSTNEYHCITDVINSNGEDYMQILNIQFAPTFIYAANRISETSFMNIFLNRTAQFRNLLTRENPHTKQIREKFLSVKRECEEKKPCYYTEVYNEVVSILIDIYRYYGYAKFQPPQSNIYKDISGLQKAISYINSNFCYDISLDDIATVARTSKFHFMRLFKSTYNMTTWDYINIKRIDKAISLLSTTDETILNIATQCGFNNSANFNRIFKKITQLTPKQYRRN